MQQTWLTLPLLDTFVVFIGWDIMGTRSMLEDKSSLVAALDLRGIVFAPPLLWVIAFGKGEPPGRRFWPGFIQSPESKKVLCMNTSPRDHIRSFKDALRQIRKTNSRIASSNSVGKKRPADDRVLAETQPTKRRKVTLRRRYLPEEQHGRVTTTKTPPF
jgi:hypothetical protein